MSTADDEPKALIRLKGELKTPPLSMEARIEAGWLLRRLQEREMIGMPHSRPMPSIGPRCHELRIGDENRTWRIIYRIDSKAIIMVEVFNKTTRQTPKDVIANCKARLARYDEAMAQAKTRKPNG